jgi:hypothetical protein
MVHVLLHFKLNKTKFKNRHTMKKTILGCFLIASMGAMAQSSTKENKATHATDEGTCAFTMADGKMMMVVDGKTVTMEKEMKTKNGDVVMLDGTVKSSNGKSIKMKNGDCIDMSGKMIWVKNEQINDIDKPSHK